jgi:hypothetical protein
MIDISLGGLILASSLVGLAFVCVDWIIAMGRLQRHEIKRRANVITCRICSVRYEVAPETQLSRCPSCETPNEPESDTTI